MFFVRFKKNGIPLRFADFEVFSLFYSYLIKTNTCFVFGTRSKRATQIDLETKTKKGFLLLLCFFVFILLYFPILKSEIPNYFRLEKCTLS